MYEMAQALTRAGYKSTREMLDNEVGLTKPTDYAAYAPDEWLEQAKVEYTHSG